MKTIFLSESQSLQLFCVEFGDVGYTVNKTAFIYFFATYSCDPEILDLDIKHSKFHLPLVIAGYLRKKNFVSFKL